MNPGDKLGPYEILASIGAGGMGEVYKARDTRLGRDVAIKFSREQFSERFEREARAIAALNHPNICTLHDVGPNYLVMELIDGETLADRIKRGAIPVAETLAIATKIADALEAAHEKGIVHRDLKPANIKVSPEGSVKVLDFGLAKTGGTVAAKPEDSPTLSMATQAGVILGTAAYMSPEQARGKPADTRADIWAFGCVVFEMLTGRQLFHGETISDIIAAVLAKDPDVSLAPAKVQRLLKSCLEKDPRKRLQSIGDWRLLLDTAPPERAQARRLPWIVAGGLAMLSLALAFLLWRSPPRTSNPFLRFDADVGADVSPGSGEGPSLAISPDGTRVAFLTHGGNGKDRLAMRRLEGQSATIFPGTDGAASPFFSPDGRWIAFFADHKLKKISVEGEEPLTLCDAQNPRGGAWGPDGTIVFEPEPRAGLFRVFESGGAPQPATKLDTSQGEITHRLPQFLPRGDAVLFLTRTVNDSYEEASCIVQSLRTGKRATLIKGGYGCRYLPTGDVGHLVYLHDGTLFAAPMDAGAMKLTGDAVPVLEDVSGWYGSGNGIGQFDISATGTLAYLRAAQKEFITMVDRSGSTQKLALPAERYAGLRVSPDAKRIAVATEADSLNVAISIYDLASRTTERLLSFKKPPQLIRGFGLTWTPDGSHLAFGADSGPSGPGIYWFRTDAPGDPVRLIEGTGMDPSSFSPDGRKLAYWRTLPPYGIWILPLDLSDPEHPKAGNSEPFLQSGDNGRVPNFSPDGKWISYYLGERGQGAQTYVQSYPVPGGRIRIVGGAMGPWWSGARSELLLITGAGRPLSVEYSQAAGSFHVGEPKPWSNVTFPTAAGRFDFTPDGEHAVILTPADERPAAQMSFLLNFFDELRRRAPQK